MKRLEWHLLALVPLALVAFGLVMVYDATSAPAALGNGDPMAYLQKQAVYALIGLGLMIAASRFDYRRLRYVAPGLVLSSLFLCVAVLVIGARVNGARRWLWFGPAAFQPSELAKLALVVWAASYLAKRRAPRTLRELWRPVGLLCLIFCVLILLEPDLGTAIALVVSVAAVLVVSGTPARPLLTAGGIVATLGLLAVWLEPYRRARFFSFLDPWKDAQGAGYQTVQALIGLGSGGWFGAGLGNGVSKDNFLPEAHTDMILAVVGEELGLVGLALVLAAFVALAYAGLRAALACRDPFGKRLAAGLTALLCGQALINMAAVLGLAPLTGIPLPFISYGGSSLVVALAGVGILLNIAGGHAGTRTAQVPDRSRRDARPPRAGARGRRVAAGARGGGDLRRVAGARRSQARP